MLGVKPYILLSAFFPFFFMIHVSYYFPTLLSAVTDTWQKYNDEDDRLSKDKLDLLGNYKTFGSYLLMMSKALLPKVRKYL